MSSNDAAFSADEASLSILMRQGEKDAYAIPMYQRRYVWNRANNQQLWDDLLVCYSENTNHFLGSLVLMAYHPDEYGAKSQADILVENAYKVKHVVDGQQRLTSLSLALAALYWDMWEQEPVFTSLPDKDDEDSEDWGTLKVKVRGFLSSDVKDQLSKSGKGKIPRLIPVKSVYEPYKAITNREKHGRQLLLEKAFIFYRAKISELREKLFPQDTAIAAREFYEFYSKLCDAMTIRMKFVRIVCSDGEDPFQVFESLNGTGQSLTGADRIKNVLMGKGSHENPPVPMSQVESQWARIEDNAGGSKEIEAFISGYLFTKVGARVPRRDLCDVFTKNYLASFPSVSKALKDLVHAADLYGTIALQKPYEAEVGETKELDEKVKILLQNILKNNRQQAVVPLLATAREYGFGTEFEYVAARLLKLLVRYKVCQKSTNTLDKVFEQFCAKVGESTPMELLDYLKLNMPTDPIFMSEFASMTFESNKQADFLRARYYLLEIENYLRNQNGQDNLLTQEEYTLEHVIPQTFDQTKWFEGYPDVVASFDDETGAKFENFRDYTIDSIGNMCLLRRPENSAASNRNFAAKLKSYEKADSEGKTAVGTFQLVRQIKDNTTAVIVGASSDDACQIVLEGRTFDEESVMTRAKAMSEIAAKIW